ncbi:hypothetical protein TREMEDRAFT_62288 [Tremella mesenterica DSM 1558]|uniref:uncharacterized protein n=1 Tax=Tremella mesenterica (strain ATCC 24925 / CBS 8224 / DSM 1558 / NBRC 9311 / NRRL Y-6157 / RJB 2259-6 / UBC 559-6) TaxID=578456 RepID=UPI0003F4A30C|nr:uncharacterized protein TREMEDRAFT_62288 [Tremella mesenterica DSM 1558]EIW69422.1 hypothetical protein TREMEDRAFT_62288 [Tremella mesenterica DSM 1558]
MWLILSSLALASMVTADTCYDRFGYSYFCNNNGLSYGARIGIGVGIAAGVLALVLLCSFWRRRQLQRQWAKYRPPALPVTNQSGQTSGPGQYTYGQSAPYASNPPPPSNFQYQPNGVQQPAQTYQPSMAGQYGNKNGPGMNTGNGEMEHEHGYEWDQARANGNVPPPGYEVSNQESFAPPPGAPPGKRTEGTV